MDGQRKFPEAPCAGVVVVGSELAESGWVAVDLAAYDGVAARSAFAVPARSEAAAPDDPSPARAADADEKALIKARLMTWAERLRTSEAGHASEASRTSSRPLPDRAPQAARRIPRPDIITIERRRIRLHEAPTVRLIAAKAENAAAAGPPRPGLFRSRRARFLLLGMAAAYLVTGLAHSFARWKPARGIVVPATMDGRTVIT